MQKMHAHISAPARVCRLKKYNHVDDFIHFIREWLYPLLLQVINFMGYQMHVCVHVDTPVVLEVVMIIAQG